MQPYIDSWIGFEGPLKRKNGPRNSWRTGPITILRRLLCEVYGVTLLARVNFRVWATAECREERSAATLSTTPIVDNYGSQVTISLLFSMLEHPEVVMCIKLSLSGLIIVFSSSEYRFWLYHFFGIRCIYRFTFYVVFNSSADAHLG